MTAPASTTTFLTTIRAQMVDMCLSAYLKHSDAIPSASRINQVRADLTVWAEEAGDELEALLDLDDADIARDDAQVLLDAARDLEASITQAQVILRDPETALNSTPEAAKAAADTLVGELSTVRWLRSRAHDTARGTGDER